MRACCALEGLELEGGWSVVKLLKVPKADRPDDPASGGNFCAQYSVVHASGSNAFLKALDFSSAMSAPDPMAKLNELTSDYLFERDVLDKCRGVRMTNVVMPLGHGSIDVPMPGDLSKVYYLIFEMAESDIRAKKQDGTMMASCMMKSLHGSALGIQQLHAAQIAHHDIKPSNVLLVNGTSKVSDLGRASDQNRSHRFDEVSFPGDPTYCPFEKYWQLKYDEFIDRFSTDLFMLGNLMFFYFMDVPINAVVLRDLMEEKVDFRRMTFSEVLPFLIDSFERKLLDFHSAVSDLSPRIADEVVMVARELCHPDPLMRGDPKYNDKVLKYRVSRYVSKFANLAVRARY